MRYLFLLPVTLLLTSHLAIARGPLPSNKSQFIPLLSSKLGFYELLSGNNDVCASGELAWLDKNNPDLGFQLGDNIVFKGLHNGTQTNKVANFCLVTSKFKFTTQSITMSLRHTRCDNQADSLDINKTVNFSSANTIEYRVENTEVNCKFQLQP